MKLYITKGSPYARIVRVVILEKGLSDRVEVIAARTREAGSPYYEINPSGRVPHLIRDDGVGLEDSSLICAYLDQLDGKPAFALPQGEQAWEARRMESLVRSMLDGIAVLAREKRRPLTEQSPTIIQHEQERARRMLDLWEQQIDHPLLSGQLNLIQITLASTLGFAGLIPGFSWRDNHIKLCKWFDRISERPSLAATAP